MPAVRGTDLRRILQFLEVADGADARAEDPLPRAALLALQDLIPAQEVMYFELKRKDRAPGASPADLDGSVVASSTTGGNDESPAMAEALAAFGYQNPVAATLSGLGPADGPVRQSRVIGRRELEQLDFYHTFLKPLQIRDVLKVWLHSSPETVACVSFESYDREFSDRDATILRVLQTHLVAQREAALIRRSPGLSEVTLTPREAEILIWVARGKRDEEIAQLLFISPATVRKHLKNVYEKLGVHSRAEAIGWVLRARS